MSHSLDISISSKHIMVASVRICLFINQIHHQQPNWYVLSCPFSPPISYSLIFPSEGGFFFSWPYLGTFFIKRKKESNYKRNRSQLGPALRVFSGPYYMAKISRPGTTKFANNSKYLKPAWDQVMISSETLPTISSTVWLRRSKVICFFPSTEANKWASLESQIPDTKLWESASVHVPTNPGCNHTKPVAEVAHIPTGARPGTIPGREGGFISN